MDWRVTNHSVAKCRTQLKQLSMQHARDAQRKCIVLAVFSCVLCFMTSWTVAGQTPLSMEFSGQEYQNRLPFPTPRNLPDPGIETSSLGLLHWQAVSLPLTQPGKLINIKCYSLSHVRLFVTPRPIWSMELSRPEYWSGQPFPSPGGLPNPGIESRSPTLQADSLPTELSGKPLLPS